ncbi:MAG: hypothetical protein IH874_04270 [Candidatus Dadabacteria bacterium]|nr:hypothetical protein [Candidatus Dadabacteria bacterium]
MRTLVIFAAIPLFYLSYPAQSPAQENNPSHSTLVATAYSQQIFPEQLEPEKSLRKKMRSEQSDEQYTEWLKDYRTKQLSGWIQKAMWDEFVEKSNIGVTDDQIEEFNQAMNRLSAKQREESEERRAQLKRELKSADLSAERKEEIKKQLEILDELKAFAKQRAKRKSETLAVERQVSRQFILQWKINKALYNKYGGRVIFQQAGWEPLDAYKKFIDQSDKKKDYYIIDPELKAAYEAYKQELKDSFEDYYRGGHAFMDKSEADFYFEKPWWLWSEEEQKRFRIQ